MEIHLALDETPLSVRIHVDLTETIPGWVSGFSLQIKFTCETPSINIERIKLIFLLL